MGDGRTRETEAEGPGEHTNPVTVESFGTHNRDGIVRLEVAEEHLPYVAPAAEMLEGEDGAISAHAIRTGGEIVGFFRLDIDRERVSVYAGDGGKCGLRGYLIGRGHQGKGYGLSAIPAIRDLMRRQHPDVAELVLTINCRNRAAISAYLKAGFRDTGGIHLRGGSGPKHVLRSPLR